jgi:hypothetical protein
MEDQRGCYGTQAHRYERGACFNGPEVGAPSGVTAFLFAVACEGPSSPGMPGEMNQAQALVIVAAELKLFLRPGRRGGPVRVTVDGTSSLGHVAQSLGVPLTEVGRLLVNGEPALPGYRPGGGGRRGEGPPQAPRLAALGSGTASDPAAARPLASYWPAEPQGRQIRFILSCCR